MLCFNGKRYAKNDKEFVGSLFNERTCSGYYKKLARGYLVMDMKKEPRAFIVTNNGRFIVTAYKYKGKTRYMYGLCDADSVWLGNPDKKSIDYITEG